MAIILWKQFAQNFLRSAAEKAVPVTQVVKLLRGEGIGFRYTDMLKTYRTYAHLPEVRDAYKYIPKIFRLPKEMFATAHPFQSKTFLYEGGFRLKNTVTGEVFTKPVRLPSDNWLTPNQIAEKSLEISEEGFEGYNWEVTDFNITGAFTIEEELLE